MMRMTWRVLLACLLLLLAPLAQAAGKVTATLDRTSMALGETVTLNIEADNIADATAPDFDVLLPDFVIVNRNSQQSYSIVNGNATRARIWAVALQPRRAGTLTIPSFDVAGQRTQPITLTVAAASGGGVPSGAHGNVFLTYDAEPTHAWVGQEVLLSVKLYFLGNLSQGQLNDPKVGGADIRKLGDDLQYLAQRDGRTWHVVERRYALFASRPGPLDLPPLSFRGQMQDAGVGGLGNFFGGGQIVSAESPALHLTVDAAPAHTGAWLPAHDVQLQLSGVPADGKAAVGQPLTLTLDITARGLPFEALPEPALPAIDGADVYPDKSSDHSDNDGQWIVGTRQRKFAIVPNRAGTLTIPSITLTWWNTATAQQQTATVPEHTLQVAAAAGVGGSPIPSTAASAPATAPATAASTGSHRASTTPTRSDEAAPVTSTVAVRWRNLATGLFALWVLTLLAWLWRSRRAAPRQPAAPTAAREPEGAAARRAFRSSSTAADLSRHLLAWARAERPAVGSLAELAAALDDAAQTAAIASLQRHRWGDGAPVDIAAIVAAFAQGLAWRKPAASAPPVGLPPLYPPR